ncbi:channel accessory protein ArfB [Mycobacterium angelicum]|nr:hypothetical protein [Mycobacterium angelicum]MCV7197727.1 hypothetical protein [Mycobacterium angelicum]
MGFVIQWLSCLVAFVIGSAVAWAIVAVSMKSRDEAPAVQPPEIEAP